MLRDKIVSTKGDVMNLGCFSVSLAVKNIKISKEFYENIGFEVFHGDIDEKWLMMKNGDTTIGLFEGMFDKNMFTFNPGWDGQAQETNPFDDIRTIQKDFKLKGIEFISEVENDTHGPGNFIIMDPDGNAIMVDQHR